MFIIYDPRKVSGNGHEYIIGWACSYHLLIQETGNHTESELTHERDALSLWFPKFESKFYILTTIHSVIMPNVYTHISRLSDLPLCFLCVSPMASIISCLGF